MRFIVLVVSSTVFGQAAKTLPNFDLADVHPYTHAPTVMGRLQGTQGAILRPTGRYEFTNATLLDLIRSAYNVDADKVLRGPRWLELDRFDVIAQTSPKTSAETARLMLRALLANRFGLVAHQEDRAIPGHALIGGGDGPNLKPSAGSGESGCKLAHQEGTGLEASARDAAVRNGTALSFSIGIFTYTCTNVSMAAFAAQLRSMTWSAVYLGSDPLVVDKTGLSGAWDLSFTFTQKLSIGNTTIPAANGAIPV